MRPADFTRTPPAFGPGVFFPRLRSLPRERDISAMHDPADEDDYERRRRRRFAGAEAERGVWKLRGTAMSREEAIEWMVQYAVEEEMKRRHPERYQDPDDKAGTA